MKKVLYGGVMAGVVSAMFMVTGCGGKKVQVAPAAGANGLLGTRGEVPPPLASPAAIKAVQFKGANADGAVAAVPEVGGETIPPEPTLGGEGRVTGAEPLVSVVPAAPVQGDDAFVPAPAAPVEGDGVFIPASVQGNGTPLIQDLNANTGIPAVGQGAPAVGTQTYTVQKGDSLSSIARKCGTNWKAIATANGMTNANSLKVGQVLVLPAGAVAPAQTLDVVSPAPSASVQPAPAPQVKAAPVNGEKKKTSVKPLPADGKYTVKSGDSLWKIAHKYGLSADQIRSDNKLKKDMLQPGQVLILKAPAAKTSSSAKSSADAAKPALKKNSKKAADASASDTIPGLSGDKYAVKSGDSLWLVAKRFKVSIDDIIAWNNLKDTNLHIGQVLIVKKAGAAAAAPAASAGDASVVDLGVKAPETAPAPVAEPAPVVAAPAPAANIDVNVLPAAVENAPVKPAAATAAYTVQEGDTLTTILRTNMMSPEQFKELNPWYVEGEELKPGTEIKITFEP